MYKGYNIAVAGAGYVGLTQAVFFSRKHNVVLIEPNTERVELINRKISPLKDDKLQEILNRDDIRLICTNDRKEYKDANYVIIAVPTNYDENKNYFDCSIVDSVIEDVRRVNKDAYIVIKSTVPIGYVQSVKERLGVDKIMMSPEFLREGRAMYDLLNPTRIVVGCDKEDEDAAWIFGKLLNEGAGMPAEILIMGTSEAESVKLFSNTYLAMRVAYLNELDTFAELNGLDTKSIISGVVGDSRIGKGYCNPSFGYGGYCFPKDTKQLAANCKDIPQNIISAIVESNATRKNHIVNQILKLNPKSVGVYKLAMKSGSDNTRSSAILDIIDKLKSHGIQINIYDPDNGYNITIDELKMSDLIITNRYDPILNDVKNKLYTRDCFGVD